MMIRCVCLLFVALLFNSSAFAAEKIRVLIVDGQNNHNWAAMTPPMKTTLEKTGRFAVDVSNTPPSAPRSPQAPKADATPEQKAAFEAARKKWQEEKAALDKEKPALWEKWRPKFSDYDVVVSNYNGEMWPEPVKKSFEEFVRNGGGFVVIHAANNAFSGWNEYDQMIGLGWRAATYGDRLTIDDAGKIVRTPKGDGPGAGHGPQHEFKVVVRDSEHPIMKGLPKEWMHAKDELYQGQRGPAQNMTILATAYAAPEMKGSGTNEPMIWFIPYGKGRVFTSLLGHVGGNSPDTAAIRCIGFQTTFIRGTEWAATGKVTLPVLPNFPTPTEVKLAPE